MGLQLTVIHDVILLQATTQVGNGPVAQVQYIYSYYKQTYSQNADNLTSY